MQNELEALFRKHYYPPMDKDWRYLDELNAAISRLISEEVERVIGEDEPFVGVEGYTSARNALRAEQRKRLEGR